MKPASVVKLAVVATVFRLGDAVAAQSFWPGVAFDRGSTEAAGVEQITYGNGLFLAVGGSRLHPPGGITATSPDGFHWTVHTPSSQGIVGVVSGVAAGSNNFVVVGNQAAYFGDPAGQNGLIQLSPDGTLWGGARERA